MPRSAIHLFETLLQSDEGKHKNDSRQTPRVQNYSYRNCRPVKLSALIELSKSIVQHLEDSNTAGSEQFKEIESC